MSKKFSDKKVHIIGAGDQRMPVSGMKVKQAINDARRWWNNSGRDRFRAARDRDDDGIRDDDEIMAKSGILAGKLFDECDNKTKHEIVKRWHRAWCATELGIEGDAAFEYQGVVDRMGNVGGRQHE